jgi:hypothetical protein
MGLMGEAVKEALEVLMQQGVDANRLGELFQLPAGGQVAIEGYSGGR